MKKLDKKQVPQVIILVVLACAVFGWFAFRMITPTPAAAHSPSAAPVPTPVAGAPAGTAPAVPTDAAGLRAKVPPPGPGLRDPFVQAISDQAAPAPAPATAPAPAAPHPASPGGVKPVKVAALPPVVPAAPPLLGGLTSPWVRETPASGPPVGRPTVAPRPVVIPPPAWTVTGVLASGSEHVAVLRDGDARRFVKKGDALDGLYVVAAVTGDAVVLRHGSLRFTLPLGGAPHAAQAARLAAPRHGATPKAPAAPSIRDLTRAEPAPSRVAQAAPVAIHKPSRRLAVKSVVSPLVRNVVSAACPRPAAYVTPVIPASPFASGLLPLGSFAPDFSLRTLGGDAQSLSQYRGRVVLLHFWSSWCPSCRTGLPLLAQLGDEYGPKGLVVLSVNSWDNVPSLRSFLGRQGLTASSVLYDPSVANESVAVRLFKAPDVPALYLIDQNGAVAATYVGYSAKVITDIRRVLASLGVS